MDQKSEVLEEGVLAAQPAPVEELVSEEEVAEQASAAAAYLEGDMDPDLEAELEELFAASDERITVQAQNEADMWAFELFRVEVNNMVAEEPNKDGATKCKACLDALKETYDVEPRPISKREKVAHITSVLNGLVNDNARLRVRAKAFAMAENKEGVEQTVKQIESISKSAGKLLALKHKIDPLSKNDKPASGNAAQ